MNRNHAEVIQWQGRCIGNLFFIFRYRTFQREILSNFYREIGKSYFDTGKKTFFATQVEDDMKFSDSSRNRGLSTHTKQSFNFTRLELFMK